MRISPFSCAGPFLVLASFFVTHLSLAQPYTGNQLLSAVVDDKPDKALLILNWVEQDKPGRVGIINEKWGDDRRTPLHEMAKFDWAYPEEDNFPERMEALAKIVELGAELMAQDKDGRRPKELADKEKKRSTESWLRAQEARQGKGGALTAKELGDTAIGNHPRALLEMLKAIEEGKVDRNLLNQGFGNSGRTVMHEMIARDWAHSSKDSAKKKEALDKAFLLGGNMDVQETTGSKLPVMAMGDDITKGYMLDKRKIAQAVIMDPSGKVDSFAEQIIPLINAGMHPDLVVTNPNGRTPLYRALMGGWYENGGTHREAVELMVEKGADLSRVDSSGKPVLDSVVAAGKLPETAKWLKELLGLQPKAAAVVGLEGVHAMCPEVTGEQLGQLLVDVIHHNPENKELIEALLNHPSTNINARNPRLGNDTPLLAIVSKCLDDDWYWDTAWGMIEKGADPDVQRFDDRDFYAYVDTACGNNARAQTLKSELKNLWPTIGTWLGRRLTDAIVNDNKKQVTRLISNPRTDVNAKKEGEVGNAPIHALAALGRASDPFYADIMRRLLERGANLTLRRTNKNQTPTDIFNAESGKAGIAETKKLYDELVSISEDSGRLSNWLGKRLFDAIMNGYSNKMLDIGHITSLVNNPETNLNYQNDDGTYNNTILHLIAAFNLPKDPSFCVLTEQMLDRGADVNKRRKYKDQSVLDIAEVDGDCTTKAVLMGRAAPSENRAETTWWLPRSPMVVAGAATTTAWKPVEKVEEVEPETEIEEILSEEEIEPEEEVKVVSTPSSDLFKAIYVLSNHRFGNTKVPLVAEVKDFADTYPKEKDADLWKMLEDGLRNPDVSLKEPISWVANRTALKFMEDLNWAAQGGTWTSLYNEAKKK